MKKNKVKDYLDCKYHIQMIIPRSDYDYYMDKKNGDKKYGATIGKEVELTKEELEAINKFTDGLCIGYETKRKLEKILEDK